MALVAVVAGVAAFGEHFAVALIVEAVGQAAPEAGQPLELLHRDHAQFVHRRRMLQVREEVAGQRIDRRLAAGLRRCRLELDQGQIADAVRGRVESPAGDRAGADRGRAIALRRLGQRRSQRGERIGEEAHDARGIARGCERAPVLAERGDPSIGAGRDQPAVRLDRAGHANRLVGTVGEVGLRRTHRRCIAPVGGVPLPCRHWSRETPTDRGELNASRIGSRIRRVTMQRRGGVPASGARTEEPLSDSPLRQRLTAWRPNAAGRLHFALFRMSRRTA